MGDAPFAIILGGKDVLPYVYPDSLIQEIGRSVRWALPPEKTTRMEAEEVVAGDLPPGIEYIFSTWGQPRLDAALLDRLPRLKAVLYSAGSIRSFVTDESWKRGIRIFSAAKANAIPVAEYTLAQIILGLKQALPLRIREARAWKAADPMKASMVGNFHSRVGLISYGSIARLVRRLLRNLQHEVLVWDPHLSVAEAEAEGVHLASLEDIFRYCHAVSLHTPLLKETIGLIRGEHFASMQPHAVFINTARGKLVRESEMVEVLRTRPDITAILDVLEEEPPLKESPLFGLPNAWVTPHIAGSMGHECQRMAVFIHEAFLSILAGEPSSLEVREADMSWIA